MKAEGVTKPAVPDTKPYVYGTSKPEARDRVLKAYEQALKEGTCHTPKRSIR